MPHPREEGQLFEQAVAIMRRLRAPDGCPWDREQTFDSIRKYTLEETYEVFDAIDRRDWPGLEEELGDLLLQVLFYAQMAADEDRFSIAGVIGGLNRKLIRRHPHVFGEQAAAAAGNSAGELEIDGIGAEKVLRNWDEIKRAEKASRPAAESRGRLAAIPRSFPALLEAHKLGSAAARAGFDWPSPAGLLDKVREEAAEIEAELAAGNREALAAEVGDLLFTVVNLARHLGVDPEFALRGTNARFRSRFASMEATAPQPLEELDPAALEALWAAAKQQERA